MKSPRSHQTEAINNVVEHFNNHDRCNIIMPCGTGKTLTCLWISEKLKCKTTVVLVPSIALLNQIYLEFKENTILKNVCYIAVCSYTLLENKGIFYAKDKITFRKLLNVNKNKYKFIFATYQSAHILEGNDFDFLIFDEAHRTTGIGKKCFSSYVVGDSIKSTKKLFISATPKVFISKVDKTFSMNDVKKYGSTVYSLSFENAIEKKLICDYRVIISNIKNNAPSENIKEAEVIFSLHKAIVESGSKKIITFHQNIFRSVEFSKNLKKDNKFSEYSIYVIHSNMPISKRKIILNNFKNDDKSIICNARCLTEGVDVPSVDMVAFIDHKCSEVDIVQAVGRCLRKNKNKTFGYIFIPTFIEEEKIELLDQSKYRHIWRVLMNIPEFFIYKDSKNIINDSLINKSKEKLITSNFDLKNIDRIIDIFFYDRKSKWELFYNKLKEIKDKTGSLTFIRDKKLNQYAKYLREEYRKGTLFIDWIKLLNDIGFSFDVYGDQWWQQFDKFEKNKDNYNNIKSIKSWIARQRMAFKKGQLSDLQIQAFEKIGFNIRNIGNIGKNNIIEFNFKRKDMWFENFEKLKNGEKNTSLKYWIKKQKASLKKGLLSFKKEMFLKELLILKSSKGKRSLNENRIMEI